MRREHVDGLYQARTRSTIRACAMRQRLVPDDEVAGAAAERASAEGVQIFGDAHRRRRQGLQPVLAPALKARHHGEGALLGRSVGQIKNALRADGIGIFRLTSQCRSGPGNLKQLLRAPAR